MGSGEQPEVEEAGGIKLIGQSFQDTASCLKQIEGDDTSMNGFRQQREDSFDTNESVCRIGREP